MSWEFLRYKRLSSSQAFFRFKMHNTFFKQIEYFVCRKLSFQRHLSIQGVPELASQTIRSDTVKDHSLGTDLPLFLGFPVCN